MFSLNLKLDDCTEVPRISDEDIYWHNSSLSFYRNDAIRVGVFTCEKNCCILVREDCANPLPWMLDAENAWRGGRILECKDFEHIYEAFQAYPGEIALIETATGPFGSVARICTGPKGICPLYFSISKGRLNADWDFAAIARLRSAPVPDLQFLLRSAYHAFYTSRTPFQHVTMLPRNAALQWDNNGFVIEALQQREAPQCDGEDGSPVETFSRLLTSELAVRAHQSTDIALELSGGLDSRLVATFLGSRSQADLQSLGIIISDKQLNGPQQERRDYIISRYGLKDYAIPIADHIPDFGLAPGDIDFGLPFCEFHIEAFDLLWDHGHEKGRKYIYSGHGGDELFPSYNDEPAKENQVATPTGPVVADDLKGFFLDCLTEKGRELALDEIEIIAVDPAEISTLIAMQRHTPLVMRKGLWPVYPLISERLQQYCYGLPAELRRKKRLAVDVLSAKLENRKLFDNYPKENFLAALQTAVVNNQSRLKQLLQSSPLADYGLVDRDRMKQNIAFCLRPENAYYTGYLSILFYLDRFLRAYG